MLVDWWLDHLAKAWYDTHVDLAGRLPLAHAATRLFLLSFIPSSGFLTHPLFFAHS